MIENCVCSTRAVKNMQEREEKGRPETNDLVLLFSFELPARSPPSLLFASICPTLKQK
jgi:hypothetical protein